MLRSIQSYVPQKDAGGIIVKLYRYMLFEYFMDLVQSKTLFFVNPLTEWPDSNEGFLFHAAQEEDGRRQIIEFVQDKKVGTNFLEDMQRKRSRGLYADNRETI